MRLAKDSRVVGCRDPHDTDGSAFDQQQAPLSVSGRTCSPRPGDAVADTLFHLSAVAPRYQCPITASAASETTAPSAFAAGSSTTAWV